MGEILLLPPGAETPASAHPTSLFIFHDAVALLCLAGEELGRAALFLTALPLCLQSRDAHAVPRLKTRLLVTSGDARESPSPGAATRKVGFFTFSTRSG